MEALSLFKIADALQMPLETTGKAVIGERKATFKSNLGFEVPLQLTARAIFYSEQVGVVVHVLGDLYLLVAHNPDQNGLSAFIIDGAMLEGDVENIVEVKWNLRNVIAEFGKAVRAAFYMKGGEWATLKIPGR